MEKAEEYKGIKFIRISKLPAEEAEQIAPWSRSRRITILTEQGMWRDCIQFKDYKDWYENNFQPEASRNEPLVNERKNHPAQKRTSSEGRLMRYFYTFLEKN